MREFIYEVKDPMGFHARPASRLFMKAREFDCRIEIATKGETADGKNLLALMGLGIREGEVLRFRFDGSDEEEAEKALKEVLAQIDLDL